MDEKSKKHAALSDALARNARDGAEWETGRLKDDLVLSVKVYAKDNVLHRQVLRLLKTKWFDKVRDKLDAAFRSGAGWAFRQPDCGGWRGMDETPAYDEPVAIRTAGGDLIGAVYRSGWDLTDVEPEDAVFGRQKPPDGFIYDDGEFEPVPDDALEDAVAWTYLPHFDERFRREHPEKFLD